MKRRGFTIGEVLVAIAVLAIAVLGLVSVQIYALRATEGNRQRLEASEIAGSVMAGLESRFSRGFPTVASSRAPVVDHPDFDCEVSESIEDPGTKRMKRVTVKVYYKDRAGEHDYTLWTFFHDYNSAGK